MGGFSAFTNIVPVLQLTEAELTLALLEEDAADVFDPFANVGRSHDQRKLGVRMCRAL